MAIYCPNPECGREVKPGAKFCGYCATVLAPAEEHTIKPEPAVQTKPRDSFASVNRMPQGIALGGDEVIVKKYTVGRYTLRQGAIDVIITNKRIIRYEESSWLGLQSNQIDEVHIDAVQGFGCKMARSVSIIGLVMATLFGLFGLILLFSAGNMRRGGEMSLIFGLLMLGFAAGILILSFRPSMEFWVQGAVGGTTLQTSVNMIGRLFGKNNSSLLFQFKPTAETTVMLKEIGACVYDLKTLGDKAIEKWR